MFHCECIQRVYISAPLIQYVVSGHSTQVVNKTGTEDDGMDEGMYNFSFWNVNSNLMPFLLQLSSQVMAEKLSTTYVPLSL